MRAFFIEVENGKNSQGKMYIFLCSQILRDINLSIIFFAVRLIFMQRIRKITVLFLFFLGLSILWGTETAGTSAKVKTYPAPESERVICSYSVSVNGKPLDIYKASSPAFEGGEYYFTYFDFSGEVDVKVSSKKGFSDATEIFPQIFKEIRKGNEISFKADKPFNIAVLRKERDMPILIFGNPLETDIPNADDPNVKYFAPGLHVLDTLNLADNQTLYIAGGAVVKSTVIGKGKNIKVRGRGVLSFDHRERFFGNSAKFVDCRNLSIDGIIFRGANTWNLILSRCNGVEIDNIKICGSRMINDDAIDICNSSNVSVKNSFIRAQDDIIAVKGMAMKGDSFVYNRQYIQTSPAESLPCENIFISDCVFWTDRANIFRIGFECWAPYMKNINVKNIHVAYYGTPYREPKEVWSKAIIWLGASEGMPMGDMNFENITVRSDGRDMPILIANPRTTEYLKNTKPGLVKNCSFKNIKVIGKKGDFRGQIFLAGAGEDSKVSNMQFENIEYFSEKQNENSTSFEIGDFTEEISVK